MFKMYAIPLVVLLLTSCQAECPPFPWSTDGSTYTCIGPCDSGKCTTDLPSSTGTCLQALTYNQATNKCEKTCDEGETHCVITDLDDSNVGFGGGWK